ncbi:hypothetical protein [Bremerella alba]|uniref:Carboxypeptidase regulatory-like domain-containing protein n=1 Tax=Bremerella alba TaxID=980252 RepID=A0A7V9A5B3_9BACT|nr:hypothetical protein [Bremerella alba]MBA2113018.1 hypothetical protein [Bremerella alba]
MTKYSFGLLLCVFVCTFTVGCGPGGPPSGKVTGSVTYNDKPLMTGTVILVPEQEGLGYAQGTIQPDGTYQAETKEYGQNIPVGSYRVMISAVEDRGPEHPARPLIPFHYSSEAQSGLQANVQEGDNTIDFHLTK